MSSRSAQPVLQGSGLIKTYHQGPEEVQVLRGVDFAAWRGERVAVVGSSGSGKTTLLNLLGGIDHLTAGQVRLAGIDLKTLDERALCRFRNEQIGFVYQFHHLLPEFTALENVALPLLLNRHAVALAREQATQMLQQVGLGHRLQHKPSELSGGERQRVAIARALVNGPALVLMDEPTGNLDSRTSNEIQELMARLSEGGDTCFVVITHDQAFAERMDRVLRLEAGRLLPQD